MPSRDGLKVIWIQHGARAYNGAHLVTCHFSRPIFFHIGFSCWNGHDTDAPSHIITYANREKKKRVRARDLGNRFQLRLAVIYWFVKRIDSGLFAAVANWLHDYIDDWNRFHSHYWCIWDRENENARNIDLKPNIRMVNSQLFLWILNLLNNRLVSDENELVFKTLAKSVGNVSQF